MIQTHTPLDPKQWSKIFVHVEGGSYVVFFYFICRFTANLGDIYEVIIQLSTAWGLPRSLLPVVTMQWPAITGNIGHGSVIYLYSAAPLVLSPSFYSRLLATTQLEQKQTRNEHWPSDSYNLRKQCILMVGLDPCRSFSLSTPLTIRDTRGFLSLGNIKQRWGAHCVPMHYK